MTTGANPHIPCPPPSSEAQSPPPPPPHPPAVAKPPYPGPRPCGQCAADPHARTKDGVTPLMFAAIGGSVACVQALLHAKADLTIPPLVPRAKAHAPPFFENSHTQPLTFHAPFFGSGTATK